MELMGMLVRKTIWAWLKLSVTPIVHTDLRPFFSSTFQELFKEKSHFFKDLFFTQFDIHVIDPSIPSMPTLSDYPGVSHIQTESPANLPLSRTSHEVSRIKQKKALKMHLSDIFWPILGILGKTFFILDDFL